MQQSGLQKVPAPFVRGGSARLYTRQIAVLAYSVLEIILAPTMQPTDQSNQDRH